MKSPKSPLRRALIVSAFLVSTSGMTILSAMNLSGAEPDLTGWREIKFQPFTLRVPSGMTNVPVHGIDSLVGTFVSSNIIVSFDYGSYSGSAQSIGTCTGEKTKIDGYAAEIITCQVPRTWPDGGGKTNYMAARFGKPFDGGRTGLSITAYCKETSDCPTVRKIFESLRFKKK